ncbi:MAG: trypsin-like serine protease [Chloroflexota bacterium]
MKLRLGSLFALMALLLFLVGSVNADLLPTEKQVETASPLLVDVPQTDTSHPLLTPALITDTHKLVLSAQDKGSRNNHAKANAQKVVHYETNSGSSALGSYIIQFEDAPLATYDGSIANLQATSPKVTGERKLNVRSANSQSYRSYLGGKRADFVRAAESALNRPLKVIHEYDVVYNGVSVLLTPVEAAKLLGLDNVATIQRDQMRYALTGDSPDFLGIESIWDGSDTGGAGDTKGEGIIIGVIDTGIWPEHPSFADDGSFPAPPESWPAEDVCDAPEATTDTDNGGTPYDAYGYSCNNKLIGIQYTLDTYAAVIGYDGLFFSGRDDDGHGTHTASTAGGNEDVPASMYGNDLGTVSGMAPRAHVASYKGLGPGGGFGSDLVASIEKATEDGVDVINYSVGGGASDPWVDADALAYLAAREAGIFVATSAGNSGPDAGTVGSPGNAPWMMTVGASYFDRVYFNDITITGPGSPPSGISGTSNTDGITDFRLVSAANYTDTLGDTSGKCINPFAPGTFELTDVVMCESGAVSGGAKAQNVNDGTGGAVIVYNSPAAFDLSNSLYPIPSTRILKADGDAMLQYLADNPGADIRVSFTDGAAVYAPDARVPVDTVVGFSSRGPNLSSSGGAYISVMKPDVTAPGIQVLAGASPQNTDRGKQGELFQVIQGTSMSSPHVAGLGALIAALHPDWTPSEIQSALMMTARNDGQMSRGESGDSTATPFDMGSGMVNPVEASKAGFVLDETIANYEDSNPALGGSPSALNIASLTDAACVSNCSWTRTLTSTQSSAVTWDVTVTSDAGLTLTVEPTSFTLPAGGTQVVTITADVSGAAFDTWLFGDVDFTANPSSANIADAHFPVAVMPVAGQASSTEVSVSTRRDQSSYTIQGLTSVATSDLTINAYLGESESTMQSIPVDPTNGDPYDLAMGGVYTMAVEVDNTVKRLAIEIVASTAPDLDLYVGTDDNNNGQPDADEELCSSTSGSWEEVCVFPEGSDPITTGTYWILVQNWAGSGAATDDFTLDTTIVGNATSAELTASGPTTVALQEEFDVQLNWNIADFSAGQSRFGVVEVGTGAGTPNNVAILPVTILRAADDVTKSVSVGSGPVSPGDTVDYTVTVVPEPVQSGVVQYTITDTLPAGLTYVPGSASITPTISGNQLIWSITSKTADYVMTTNATDASCSTPFGPYVNLANFGIFANPNIHGDDVVIRVDDIYGGSEAFNFYGIDYPKGLYITDNGFGTMDKSTTNPAANVDIPNAADPNNLLAAFWRDFEIVYDEATNRGVTIAGAGGGSLMIMEFDDVEPAPAGSTSDRYDFEITMLRQVDDSPGAYEIIFSYDNINGAVTPGTIGLENADGSQGVKYAYNDASALEDLVICFDFKVENIITYQATVDSDATPGDNLVNTLVHTTDHPNTVPVEVESSLEVADVFLEITADGPSEIVTGPITYTLTVSNTGSSSATNLVITSQLPPGTEFVSGGSVGGSLNLGTYTWNIASLGPNSHTQVHLVVSPTQQVSFDGSVGESGQARVPDVVGGIEAEPGAWPWQVALMFSDTANGYNAQFCGGSLIAADWVVTAAHCTEGLTAAEIDVAAGRHTLSSDQGQRIRVSQIVNHQSYSPATLDNDIALLRLSEPVELEGSLALAGLISFADESLLVPNSYAVVTGWGATNGNGSDYPDNLQQAAVPLVTNEACSAAYDPQFGEGSVTSNMLCAGYSQGGIDSCFGDSGGPLVFSDGNGGWKLGGIVSWGGDVCATSGEYGVYVRVPNYVDWTWKGLNTYEFNTYSVVDDTASRSADPGHSAVGTDLVVTTVGLFLTEDIYVPLISR